MKPLIVILLILNLNIAFGQAKDEKEFYEIINSFIAGTRKATDRLTIIDSIKISENHIDEQYILSFQVNQDKDLKELLNTDSTWIKLIKEKSIEQETTLNKKYFDPLLVNFVTNNEFKKYWDKDSHFKWKKFKRRFKSDGIMEFSTLRTLNDKGLIYYDIRRGPLNGAGFMVLLERSNGLWTQKLSARIWEQ